MQLECPSPRILCRSAVHEVRKNLHRFSYAASSRGMIGPSGAHQGHDATHVASHPTCRQFFGPIRRSVPPLPFYKSKKTENPNPTPIGQRFGFDSIGGRRKRRLLVAKAAGIESPTGAPTFGGNLELSFAEEAEQRHMYPSDGKNRSSQFSTCSDMRTVDKIIP